MMKTSSSERRSKGFETRICLTFFICLLGFGQILKSNEFFCLLRILEKPTVLADLQQQPTVCFLWERERERLEGVGYCQITLLPLLFYLFLINTHILFVLRILKNIKKYKKKQKHRTKKYYGFHIYGYKFQ